MNEREELAYLAGETTVLWKLASNSLREIHTNMRARGDPGLDKVAAILAQVDECHEEHLKSPLPDAPEPKHAP